MQLRQIEIDFDIHQMIELERRGFDEPPFMALRRLLKLPETNRATKSDKPVLAQHLGTVEGGGRPFVEDGVSIPHGSSARMKYMRGKQVYEGQFIDGKLVIEGIEYSALSPAASALGITRKGFTTSLNGWLYWEAKFPGESTWHKLSDLREKANKR